jgi:hypothetical protein
MEQNPPRKRSGDSFLAMISLREMSPGRFVSSDSQILQLVSRLDKDASFIDAYIYIFICYIQYSRNRME